MCNLIPNDLRRLVRSLYVWLGIDCIGTAAFSFGKVVNEHIWAGLLQFVQDVEKALIWVFSYEYSPNSKIVISLTALAFGSIGSGTWRCGSSLFR